MDICIVGVKAEISQNGYNASDELRNINLETYFWLLDWRQQSSTHSIGCRFVTPVCGVVDFQAPDIMDILGLAITQYVIQTIQ